MHPFLTESRELVATHITEYLTNAEGGPLSLSPWGPDVRERLAEYTLRGKLIRGSLVGFSYRLIHPGSPPAPACTEAGAAMELLQSFLLIHDDIMDQDTIRRGKPSIHAQFAIAAPARGPAVDQYGLSMGICVGDIAAFLALDRLASLSVDEPLRNRIVALVSREISLTGLAQMQDVHHGYIPEATDERILDVYTYKTGRYTFSLPMMLGAMIAGSNEEYLRGITELGEYLGRIFQIRDDQLGIFGESAVTGKPVGSDIREGKKTPFRNALLRRLPPDSPIRNSFGNPDVSIREIEAVRQAMDETGVLAEVEEYVQREAAVARGMIAALDLPDEGRAALTALLDYNLTRAV
jgi:geranylgeranyl diphosphate synthase, type I